MTIRPAAQRDFAQIRAIYAHHVREGLASFEETPPEEAELLRRYQGIAGRGLPYLVAEEAGQVLGYGYCAPYRERSAYRFTLEDSIYIRHDCQGRGTGKALLAELIRLSASLNYRQIVAVIGDSANAGSIALHASLGFVRAGVLRSVGYKLGRWVDSVLMQRPLGEGDGIKP